MASRVVTLSKAWQFNVNQKMRNTGVVLSDYRQLMRAIKTAMIGFSSNPWTVVSSSDSTTSSASDLWSADNKLVWAASNGTVHSWIVLANSNGLGSCQVLISLLGGTNGFTARICFSPGGNYTGGDSSHDPTATDEVVALASGNWSDSSFQTSVVGWISLHVEMSADGQCTRIWHMTQQGVVTGVIFIERLLNSSFSPGIAMFVNGASGQAISITNLITNFTWVFRANGINGTARCISVGGASLLPNDSSNNQNYTSDIDDTWPVCPLGLQSATAGLRGSVGLLQDMHIVTTQLRVGQAVNAAKTAACISPLVVPWNNTEMLVGG